MKFTLTIPNLPDDADDAATIVCAILVESEKQVGQLRVGYLEQPTTILDGTEFMGFWEAE